MDHPAAKVLVELADLQDQEVGDGTTSVVIIAAELLRRGNELVKNKIHPTTVMSGFRLAMREAVKYIKNNMVVQVDELGEEVLLNSAKTSMASKILGPESDFFARLAVDAVTSVKTTNSEGKARYPINAVHILKCHGKSALESELVHGFALNNVRASQAMPKAVKGAKIAMLDFNLTRHKMQLGVQVRAVIYCHSIFACANFAHILSSFFFNALFDFIMISSVFSSAFKISLVWCAAFAMM